MKKIVLVFVTFSAAFVCHAQEDKSLKYYNDANKAVSQKQFLLADSLYTLSLNLKPTADTYYNRAMVRKKLNNAIGYCEDIGDASSYGDKESTDLFFKDCSTKDTVYVNKDGMPAGKDKYSYYDVICKMKYSTDNTYRRYTKTNEKIVSYTVKNNDTVFMLTPKPPEYPEKEENIKMILMNNTVLNEDDVKDQKIRWAIVTFTVLKNGEFADIKCKTTLGRSYDDKVETVFKKYVKKWAPGEYQGRKVNYSVDIGFIPVVKKKSVGIDRR